MAKWQPMDRLPPMRVITEPAVKLPTYYMLALTKKICPGIGS